MDRDLQGGRGGMDISFITDFRPEFSNLNFENFLLYKEWYPNQEIGKVLITNFDSSVSLVSILKVRGEKPMK